MSDPDLKFYLGLTKLVNEYLSDSRLPYFIVVPKDDGIFVGGNIKNEVMNEMPVWKIATILLKARTEYSDKPIVEITGELH